MFIFVFINVYFKQFELLCAKTVHVTTSSQKLVTHSYILRCYISDVLVKLTLLNSEVSTVVFSTALGALEMHASSDLY